MGVHIPREQGWGLAVESLFQRSEGLFQCGEPSIQPLEISHGECRRGRGQGQPLPQALA